VKTRLTFLACFFVLCLHNVCFANPVIIFQLPSFGGFFTISPWYAILIDCIADFILLLIGYLVIKEVRFVVRFAFLPYFGLVFVGGIVIDTIALIPAFICNLFLPSDVGMLALFICTGLLLYFYNYFLSKKFFKLQPDQAAVIGVLMGILANPAVGWVLTNIFRR
jgi:hypothetical protein